LLKKARGLDMAKGKRAKRSKFPEDELTAISKFEVYGSEMIEKIVKPSGNSGRVYLPPDWVGKHVKIIRID
jgi:putative transposon-encoded protein